MQEQVEGVQLTAVGLVHAREEEGGKWVQMKALEWSAAGGTCSADERTSREWKYSARPRGPNWHRGTPAHL